MTNTKLTRASLMPLETYHAERPAFRARVIAHKQVRKVRLGEHLTLIFEDATTVQYQVQEMLRVERIFEGEAIQEELDAYNPLIPDGDNWKATLMIEYEDVEERRQALARLVDVEHRVWARVGGEPAVFAVADEDLDRSRADKTSAVHFLRFPLSAAMIAAARAGATVALGVDHPEYHHSVDPLPAATRDSLVADLA